MLSEEDAIAQVPGICLILPERPGYGISDPQPDCVLLDYPDDIEQLVDHLGIASFAVAGEEAELVNTLSTPEMLLVAAIYLEMAMAMIVLSRWAKYGINRWANMIIATLHALGAFASLFVVTPAIFYIFFVAVEVSALLSIVWYAWTWTNPQNA